MKRTVYFLGLLLLPSILTLVGCDQKNNSGGEHFGPSPGDGDYRKGRDGENPSEHFGPAPGDG